MNHRRLEAFEIIVVLLQCELGAVALIQRLDFQKRLVELLLDILDFQLVQHAGFFRQNGQAFGRHIGKTTTHKDAHLDSVAFQNTNNTILERGHERSMVCKHAELTFRAGGNHVIHLAGEKFSGGRYE